MIHVNDCVFDVFAEMEIVLRKNLKACKQDLRQVVEVIVNDDNVLFAWALVSASWQEEESVALLCLIAQHWVTMRRFSNANHYLNNTRDGKSKVSKNQKDFEESFQHQQADTFLHVSIAMCNVNNILQLNKLKNRKLLVLTKITRTADTKINK